MSLVSTTEDSVTWGIAAVNAALLGGDALPELVVDRLADLASNPMAMIGMLIGVIEAGAVYGRLVAEGTGSTVEQVAMLVGGRASELGQYACGDGD